MFLIISRCCGIRGFAAHCISHYYYRDKSLLPMPRHPQPPFSRCFHFRTIFRQHNYLLSLRTLNPMNWILFLVRFCEEEKSSDCSSLNKYWLPHALYVLLYVLMPIGRYISDELPWLTADSFVISEYKFVAQTHMWIDMNNIEALTHRLKYVYITASYSYTIPKKTQEKSNCGGGIHIKMCIYS